MRLLKKSKLLPYHEKVSVHTAEVIYLLLKEGVRNEASPGSSPDLMAIKNVFALVKKIMEDRSNAA